MYECFHCGMKAFIWSGDIDFSDYGLDGNGIIHDCHCTNCGAHITYECPLDGGEEKEEKNDQIEGQTDIFELLGEE